MYKIVLDGVEKTHEFEELIKVFLRPGQYEILAEGEGDLVFSKKKDKNHLKKEIYLALRELTGLDPLWGIVTGIRPVKMTGELIRKLKDSGKTRQMLEEYYCISKEKIDLVMDIYDYQAGIFGEPPQDGVGIYIGIPFCPSRCYYCSFTSNQAGKEEIRGYMSALHEEIDFVADLMEERGYWTESIYVGGGTPTTLDEDQLTGLLHLVRNRLWCDRTKEFTLEAGRADTITGKKLSIAKEAGVDRISINPQTMKEDTLVRIGRGHDIQQVEEAYRMARDTGFTAINMDIIAGLPGEDERDFHRTLKGLIGLQPENITVHSLSVKRSSELAMEDREYHYKQAETVSQMLKTARTVLGKEGYRPYYLYRLKQMSGGQENTGYCKEGTAGLYNVRIMDEHQTIIAMGAGGVSKVYYPEENRLERVPNVNNYKLYEERLSQMLDRKREGLNGGKKNADQCT